MKHVLRILLIISILLSGGATAITFHKLHFESNSPYDYCHSILRDTHGFLWLGTDNGIARYDGYELKRFVHDPSQESSIGSNLALQLLLHSDGSLWAGAKNLNRFDPATEQFKVLDITDSKSIWSMVEDVHQNIWIGGAGFGLKRINRQTDGVDLHLFAQAGVYISALAYDKLYDRIWIATNDGIYSYSPKSSQLEKHLQSQVYTSIPSNDAVKALMVDNKQRLWIATYEGIIIYNSHDDKPISFDTLISRNLLTTQFSALLQDRSGSVWIGTDKNGLYRYNENSNNIQHFPASKDDGGLPLGTVTDIFEDSENSIWVAFGGHGIRRFNEKLEKFNTYRYQKNSSNSLSAANILDLHEDEKGNVWIATDGGGLDKFSPSTGHFTNFNRLSKNIGSLSSDSILALEPDSNGMWVGTWGGGLHFFNFSKSRFDDKHFNAGLHNKNVFVIHRDHEDWLLLSIWRAGLQRLNPQTGEIRTYISDSAGEKSGIKNVSINAIEPVQGKSGQYWIGGHAGLEMFDLAAEKFKPVVIPKIESIYDLYHDSRNRLWIASSEGFLRYEPKSNTIKHYDESHGLNSRFIVSIEPHENRLWLGTRDGLSVFDVNTESFENFDLSDGLASNTFNRYSHLKTHSGDMYFGGVDGLTGFNPSQIPRNPYPPNIVITKFFINHYEQGISHQFPKTIQNMKRIDLQHAQRNVSFLLSALNLISPEKNRYRYRLTPYESNWIESKSRWIHYTNLNPGTYELQIQASNNDGIWNTHGLTKRIVIHAPIWMTPWFKISVSLAVVFTLIFITLREKRRNRTLLNAVHELRLSEAKHVFTMNHDTVTGLPNRKKLFENLKQLKKYVSRHHDYQFTVMMLDGNKFKSINDRYGHNVGDSVLKVAAMRLKGLFRSAEAIQNIQDNVYRLGGDEFTIVIVSDGSKEHALCIASDIIALFDEPILIDGISISFKFSIGIYAGADRSLKIDELMNNADTAMYAAKAAGPGNYIFYESAMDNSNVETIVSQQALYQAIDNNNIQMRHRVISNSSGVEFRFDWLKENGSHIKHEEVIRIAKSANNALGLWAYYLKMSLNIYNEIIPYGNVPLISELFSALEDSQKVLTIIDKTFEGNINYDQLCFLITMRDYDECTTKITELIYSLRKRGAKIWLSDYCCSSHDNEILHSPLVDGIKLSSSLFADSSIAHLHQSEEMQIIDSVHKILKMNNKELSISTDGLDPLLISQLRHLPYLLAY